MADVCVKDLGGLQVWSTLLGAGEPSRWRGQSQCVLLMSCSDSRPEAEVCLLVSMPADAMIAEIMLYSYGYLEARSMARKLVQTYR